MIFGNKYTLPKNSLVSAIQDTIGDLNNPRPTLIKLLKEYANPLKDELADIFFIKYIVESQERVDNTVVYIGNRHTENINKALLEFGYTNIYFVGQRKVLFFD